MSRLRSTVLGGCAAVLLATGLGGRAAEAGEPAPTAAPAPDPLTALLAAAEARLRVGLEEARILEAEGLATEAAAALARAGAAFDDALATARTLAAGRLARDAAPGRTRRLAPVAGPAPAPTVPIPPTAPVRIGRTAAPPAPAPRTDPVASAIVYLLRCQDGDGLFDPGAGRAPQDPAAATDPLDATGVALLALLDAAPTSVGTRDAVGLATDRAVRALVARATAPLPTWPAWALAAYAARSGDAAVLPAVVAAAAARMDALAASRADRAASLPTAALDVAFLHEVADLARLEPLPEPLLRRLGETFDHEAAAALALHEAPPAAAAARYALDLLALGEGRGPVARSDALAGTPAPDPVALLLATVWVGAVHGSFEHEAGRGFLAGVLVPAMDRQRTDGPAAGSFDGAGDRLPRTALGLLAWKVPTTGYVEPRARPGR